eukprot:8724-Eustigmatos_ZCMA.PRE.1
MRGRVPVRVHLSRVLITFTEEPRSGAWTPSEHRAFLAAWEEHGNDWSKIAQTLGTRTRVQ